MSEAIVTQNPVENRRKTLQGRPWPKGVSGNPGGRPKHKFISEALRKALASGDADVLANELLELGKTGKAQHKIAAITAIRDTTEGKPTQQVNITAGIDESTAQRLVELSGLLGLVSAPVIDSTELPKLTHSDD